MSFRASYRELFGFRPYRLGPSSNRSIGQAFADDAFGEISGPLNVTHAQGNAAIVAEVELRKIAVKVLLIAMLIDAFHVALEDGESTLNGVGVDARISEADVLALTVAGEAVTVLKVR
ncbi:hypothetical protein J2X36_003133 [Methylobacterium sp. BE186]|nr:hypothetical protein [Methylobacterium sp. BE186]